MKNLFQFDELKDFLEIKYQQYNTREFIDSDPIQIPHSFTRKEDIEIAALLTSLIAWGKRAQIIKSARKWMELMDNAPYDFVTGATDADLRVFNNFVHRTLNASDAIFLVKALQKIYTKTNGLESICNSAWEQNANMKYVLASLRKALLSEDENNRAAKHISDVNRGSAAKRLNLFLMWMIRKDHIGVHFGLWKNIPKSALYIPLDVHVGNISRKLGLLERKNDDWAAVEELTTNLRLFDPNDPARFDFSLFGIGVFEDFFKKD